MNLLQFFSSTLIDILHKLHTLFSSFAGYLIALFVLVCTFFGGRLDLFYYVVIAVGFDLFWGVVTALKQRKFILSQAMTKTAVKLGIYLTMFVMVALPEKAFAQDWIIATRLVSAVICAAEIWSVLGHILICCPNFPILKLLRKYIQGEIAKKLEVDANEVEDILNGKK